MAGRAGRSEHFGDLATEALSPCHHGIALRVLALVAEAVRMVEGSSHSRLKLTEEQTRTCPRGGSWPQVAAVEGDQAPALALRSTATKRESSPEELLARRTLLASWHLRSFVKWAKTSVMKREQHAAAAAAAAAAAFGRVSAVEEPAAVLHAGDEVLADKSGSPSAGAAAAAAAGEAATLTLAVEPHSCAFLRSAALPPMLQSQQLQRALQQLPGSLRAAPHEQRAPCMCSVAFGNTQVPVVVR